VSYAEAYCKMGKKHVTPDFSYHRVQHQWAQLCCGGMVKLVNTLDSKSCAARLLGSSPSTPTITQHI
jgi:hypothetical protein